MILFIFPFLKFPAIRDAQFMAENDIPVAGNEYINRTDSVAFARPISEGTDIKGNKISYVRLDKSKHNSYIMSSITPSEILYIIIGSYKEVSSSHFCYHSSGGLPTGCENKHVSNCRQECDKLSSCVGYSVNLRNHYCYLFPSDNLCPSGWSKGSGTIATISSQLVAGKLSGYNCYRKGRMHKIFYR